MCQIKTNNQSENQDYWLEGAYEGIWTERGANDFNNQYYKVWHNTYDTMWDPVMKAFPKVDESESGQMVLK